MKHAFSEVGIAVIRGLSAETKHILAQLSPPALAHVSN